MRRERFSIRAAGRELAVERLWPDAAADGPAIVFLHEGLGCIGMWRDFPAALCRRTGLPGVVYDRWGHGGSAPRAGTRPASYLHDEARETLPELLDRLGLVRPVLFGHSDGATIALLHAAACPDNTAAIVCEAAHVFVEALTLQGIREAVAAYHGAGLRRRLARHHGEQTDAVFAGWHGCWLAPSFAAWNIEAELPRIVCPALIVQGEADEYGTPAQVAAIMRGVRGPAEQALLPGCGHVPHREAAEAVLALSADFLARHLGPAGTVASERGCR